MCYNVLFLATNIRKISVVFENLDRKGFTKLSEFCEFLQEHLTNFFKYLNS
jgi:hypothetical protein